MKDTARHTALQALLQMEQNEGYSNIIIDKALRANGLDRRDASLAAVIFYGVLERRLTLDHFLRGCLKDPRKRPDPRVWMLLRCAAYQILFLDRVPDSAVVNEAVEEAKSIKGGAYAGLVNGVLRTLSRKKPLLSLPEGTSVEDLSLRYSIPQELISLWRKSYGKAVTMDILRDFEQRPPLYIRINPLRAAAEGLKASLAEKGFALTPLPYPNGAAILEGEGSPAALEEFQQGMFHIQDLSAQLACSLLEAKPGQTLCDCCAAPGGKSFTLAEDMENTGTVYSFDLYKGRVGLIQQGAQRLGLSSVIAQRRDASKPYEELPLMDGVLCDVPCSGYGVIRRKPEIRYKPLISVKGLPELQKTILSNGAALVRPGGLLLYATCTLNPQENGEVARAFLDSHPEFEPAPFQLPGVKHLVEEPSHTLTMLPAGGGSDGFFAARFRRKGEL
ncbi:MAG: 16S rRNA (cytosine(967)-C(5))-methyltransferase RsmB [Acutalibacter sp.]|jgi:16S rRNA (cytosine967-C5)-methyltransferase